MSRRKRKVKQNQKQKKRMKVSPGSKKEMLDLYKLSSKLYNKTMGKKKGSRK